MVYDRRSADKVGPLVRWARARVARDPALRRLSVDGQVAELSRLMPDNLIGRHAAQHIRWGLEADLRRAEWRVRSIRTDDADLAEMVGEVRRVLEFGRHRELNDTLRALVRAEQDEPAPTRWVSPRRPRRRCGCWLAHTTSRTSPRRITAGGRCGGPSHGCCGDLWSGR